MKRPNEILKAQRQMLGALSPATSRGLQDDKLTAGSYNIVNQLAAKTTMTTLVFSS